MQENHIMVENNFNDKEVREIIKRALAEQKSTQSPQSSSADGVSLSELESIGAELGINTEIIRRVADQIKKSGTRKISFLGSPISIENKEIQTGLVTREVLDDLLFALPSITGEPGHGNTTKTALIWSTDREITQQTGRSTTIEIHSKNGKTHVRVEDRLGNLAGGLFGGLMGGIGMGFGFSFGFGFGLGHLNSLPFALLLPISTIGLTYILARGIFKLVTRNRFNEINKITNKIKDFLMGNLEKERTQSP